MDETTKKNLIISVVLAAVLTVALFFGNGNNAGVVMIYSSAPMTMGTVMTAILIISGIMLAGRKELSGNGESFTVSIMVYIVSTVVGLLVFYMLMSYEISTYLTAFFGLLPLFMSSLTMLSCIKGIYGPAAE